MPPPVPLLVFSCFQAFAEKPSVRIILFTPSDRDAPGGAQHRLTQIADAADRFFFTEMNRWGYPPRGQDVVPSRAGR